MAIGELKMAKLRGKQKWKHCLTVRALERELDSMSQKGLPIARQLETLKRWIKPAPNQEKLKRQRPAQIKEKESRQRKRKV